MKTRQGFVSNSSSSSFIVIGNKPHQREIPGTAEIHIGYGGHTEFGWEHAVFRDFQSRLNFAYIQTTYMSLPESIRCLQMLDRVVREETGCIGIRLTGADIGYIDHQSSASEGRNTEMFEDDDSLRRFLFCPDSYIETDNDNH